MASSKADSSRSDTSCAMSTPAEQGHRGPWPKLKVLNIGLMPMVIGLFAIGLSIYRVNRRRSYKAAAASART